MAHYILAHLTPADLHIMFEESLKGAKFPVTQRKKGYCDCFKFKKAKIRELKVYEVYTNYEIEPAFEQWLSNWHTKFSQTLDLIRFGWFARFWKLILRRFGLRHREIGRDAGQSNFRGILVGIKEDSKATFDCHKCKKPRTLCEY